MKAKIIGASIAGVVAVAVAVAIFFVGPVEVSPPKAGDFEGWNRSGPFAIDNFEYKIGDSIFIAVGGLQPTDIGDIVFVMPNGTTRYISIPFDGSEKTDFNQYFKPSISKVRKICSINDLIGEWTITFPPTSYSPIKFKIINETIPSQATYFERLC
jgi:hypothetical protein